MALPRPMMRSRCRSMASQTRNLRSSCMGIKRPREAALRHALMRVWCCRSGLLDLFQHLEDALRRADEHALEGLGQATTLESVAPGTGAFSHGGDFLVEWWAGGA